MSDVVFVQMPFAAVERPSLALGLLTSTLRTAGLSTESLYANIDFAERIGLPAYIVVRSCAPNALLGEWIFAGSAFGAAAGGPEGLKQLGCRFEVPDEFIELVIRDRGQADLTALLSDLRRLAGEAVEEVSRRIVDLRPKVVACTSMFDQHVASLAVLQRVKALDSRIITVLGGANCAGPMGRATHLSFRAVDFTVTGEFDQFAAAFFAALIAAGGDPRRVDALPANVLGPADRGRSLWEAPLPPAAILGDMDRAAIPDYDDYFEQLHGSPIGRYVLASIPLETSRGCWWGAKHHCTFCGLNAEGMSFRRKTPARALREIRDLTSRYGVFRWAATDNIIDMSYFDTVLPELAAEDRKYTFFYETKANLKREHVQALAAAGCDLIQPGLESLHDETLKIMNKGTTACGNIQLLKYCLEYGLTPDWSILCGFPGSDPEWVAQTAADLPALFHLPPPGGTVPIRFDRFSPYHQRPADYGLELEPFPAYKVVYPLDDAALGELAYFFRPVGGRPPRVLETARLAREVTARWRAEFWSERRAHLLIEDDDGRTLRIRDTRPGAAAECHELRGASAVVLRALESPASPAGLAARLAREGADGLSEADLSLALGELAARRLVWRSSSQCVALPTRPARRPMPPKAEAAVGKVDMARYLIEKMRFRRAFA